MTLLNPAALIFAALVPVIILLYLLKARRRSAAVSTLMFWQRVTATDTHRTALFQRLRQVLSLLLHLLIFGLLLFALARPELAAFHGGSGAEASTVVILDCRARMQSFTGGGKDETHFMAARRIAAGYLRRASAQSVVALLSAAGEPQVLTGFTSDEKVLLDGLDITRANDAGGRIEDAVSLARDLLAARAGNRRIVVVTDRVPVDAALTASNSVTNQAAPILEWRLTGDPAASRENVGVNRLTARALPNSPQTSEVLLELENFGATRQSGTVELSLDGRTLDVKPYNLAPGERRSEIYPALAARNTLANARGWLTARLVPGSSGGDALRLDDEAYAVIPPPRPLRALLVTRGNWFLESLFKADEQIEFNQLAPDAFQVAQAADFDVVVLDDFLPPGLGELAGLPVGNFVFIRRSPLSEAMASTEFLARPVVTEADQESPLLRLADFHDIAFLRARILNLPAATADPVGNWRFTVPVRSQEHPLVVSGERLASATGSGQPRRQRFVALAFGATDSPELPLRVAFPLFIRNTLAWAANQDEPAAGDAPEANGLRAGESLRLSAGETLWTVPQREYRALPGAIPPLELLNGPAIFQPERDGFYLRRGADGTARWLAVNTFDRETSALNGPTIIGRDERASSEGNEPVRARFFLHRWEALRVWPPWVYLALAALILCTVEWWSFHHRRTE